MDNTAWTVNHATVDGVLFRTRPSQIKKGTITDNSCIVGWVNVEIDGEAVPQKCYGVIKQFYLHFMYPPSQSTYKLTVKKLAAFTTPWILVALCEWYDHLGEQPRTGLTRIKRNHFWQSGCPIHNMSNTIPMNVCFLPEVPFNPDDFDDDGEPVKNIKNGEYDFSGTEVLNVLKH